MAHRYCVVEVVGKPFTRLQTAALEGTTPLWDYTGVVQSYGFGDVLKLAVFHKAILSSFKWFCGENHRF